MNQEQLYLKSHTMEWHPRICHLANYGVFQTVMLITSSHRQQLTFVFHFSVVGYDGDYLPFHGEYLQCLVSMYYYWHLSIDSLFYDYLKPTAHLNYRIT